MPLRWARNRAKVPKPAPTPIAPDFLEVYTLRRAAPDALQWFKFDELAPLIATIAPRMRAATQWGEANNLLTWRQLQIK